MTVGVRFRMCARAVRSGLLGVCLLIGGLAQAGEVVCHGFAVPASVVVDGQTLVLNGAGLRLATFLNIKVYVASLYLPVPTHDALSVVNASVPAQLRLVFIRDVGVGDIRKAWQEGFEKNAAAHLAEYQARVDTLNGWMVDMAKGDRLVFIRRPGVGLEVSLNERVRGVLPGDDFAHVFLEIWLGSSPPNRELKAGLLGAPCDRG